MNPLDRTRIVITRPQGQGDVLAQKLTALGAQVLSFPVTEIGPVDQPAQLLALQARLAEFSLAFFVSANAVEQCFTVMDRARWPASLAVATVGPATARSLRSHGFAEVLLPEERFDSEGVLDLPQFQAQAVAGRKILVMRGDGGRELLAETLRERGALVEQVQCYQRRCAALDPAPLLAAADSLSGIVFSNSEAITYFVQILGDSTAQALLARTPVFVPHPRIEAQARTSGAGQLVLTGAGDEGIVQGILEHLGTS